jgi:hypothetical protein
MMLIVTAPLRDKSVMVVGDEFAVVGYLCLVVGFRSSDYEP